MVEFFVFKCIHMWKSLTSPSGSRMRGVSACKSLEIENTLEENDIRGETLNYVILLVLSLFMRCQLFTFPLKLCIVGFNFVLLKHLQKKWLLNNTKEQMETTNKNKRSIFKTKWIKSTNLQSQQNIWQIKLKTKQENSKKDERNVERWAEYFNDQLKVQYAMTDLSREKTPKVIEMQK